MKFFSKLRFPKTTLVIYIVGALIWAALFIRLFMGSTLNLPPDDADFVKTVFPESVLPILIIGLPFPLLSLLLWLPLRKKGLKFIDLLYPLGTLGAIAVFVYFHFTWF